MLLHEQQKLDRIKTLRQIVASRWILHAVILMLAFIQKAFGIAHFDNWVFVLILVTYGYNLCFYLYLRRNPREITQRGLFTVSILQVVFDQLISTIILYATGGIESLGFLFYFFPIFIAIVIFNGKQIIALTLVTAVLYIGVVTLEFYGIIPHQSRYLFDPGFHRNLQILIHNGAAVVFSLFFTAFFAAFINNLIRKRENAIVTERDKIVAIVNNLVDGVILLDQDGRVVLANPYAQRLLRLPQAELANRTLLAKRFRVNVRPLVDFITNAMAQSVYQTAEITIHDGDEYVILQATLLHVVDTDGIHIGSLAILHNITKEKDLDKMKSDFISIAAHQLRTPLATLKWLMRMLLEDASEQLTQRHRELLTKGIERNQEIIEIVNNLLDISEIEDRKTPYKFVTGSLAHVIRQIVEVAEMSAAGKDITIVLNMPTDVPEITFDRQRMKMAIQNVVDNAIKYSHAGKQVTIDVTQEKEEIVCTITDKGIGMSEETQQKIFTRFFRGREAVIKDPMGSGLGLYIVRSIIEKHGGSIHFTSTLSEGTQFVIRLPVA